jgi:hypothetical protein
MITNINYLKTALEVLEEGKQDPETTIKILKTVSQICQQNIERIQERIDLGGCNESA